MAVSFGRLPEKKSLTGGIDIQISAEEDSSLIPQARFILVRLWEVAMQ